ncbi:hypothetical protein ES708_32730 [subsurface metagenome]
MIGEACHFFDLFRSIIPSDWNQIHSITSNVQRLPNSKPENFFVSIKWSDESFTSLTYTTLRSADLPKETIKIHRNGITILIRDFKYLKVSGEMNFEREYKKQLEGHEEEIHRLIDTLTSESDDIQNFEDAVKSMKLTFDAEESLVNRI